MCFDTTEPVELIMMSTKLYSSMNAVSKRVTVTAAHFGFANGETMAFGDGGNDVAMLRAAGAGVAMGNACDEALAAADYVTASVDDDGIRRALEHFGVI